MMSLHSLAVADLGEGPLFYVERKKSQKEEKFAVQAKQNCPPHSPLAQSLDLALFGAEEGHIFEHEILGACSNQELFISDLIFFHVKW